MPGAGGLPTGTVTFLFTDLEGSTRLWERHPEAMKTALAQHDELLRVAVESHGGYVVKTTGDGLHAAFGTASGAVAAAVAGQQVVADLEGPEGQLRVRMGLHTGAAEARDGDYFGGAVNRAARVSAAGHGGQILVSHATEELVRDDLGDGLVLVDLGEHRLRDLARPERIFELRPPGVVDAFPPIRTLDAYPGNLPPQLSSFVGRDEVLTELSKALDDVRLLTLTGVGGVGKTRLAIHLAAEVLPRFPDGAWLCELAAATDPDAMAQIVAATLAVTPRPGVTLEESIVGALAHKRLLLVLDNCEHLLDAAGDLAEQILRGCPDVQIVSTSREGLGVVGEQVWPLRSLAMPRRAGQTDVAELGSVQLFVDRARAVRPGFDLDGANAPAVAEICRRLDGIPLAIELAAARVEGMSATEISELLDERFRLLTGGRRTAVERHQTLRATVDWSYSLLSDVERIVLDRLSVFAGTFAAAAAAAVVSGPDVEEWDVRDTLATLVAKSLVVRDETTTGVTRYQMLETLKQYARERLDEAGSTDQWRRRHAAYYAELAEELGPALRGPNEITERARLKEEIDNLRAAVLWGLDAGERDDAEYAIRVISGLGYETTQWRSAGFALWAQNAVPRLDGTTAGRRVAILGAAAFAAMYDGDYETADQLARTAMSDGIPADCPAPNMALVATGMLLSHQGESDRAIELMHGFIAEWTEQQPRSFDLSNLHATTAVWAMAKGDHALALDHAQEAVRIARQIDNPSALVIALFQLGWASERDEPELTRAAFEESLSLTRDGASDVVLSSTLALLARLVARDGEKQTALEMMHEGLLHAYEDGDRPTFVSNVLWTVIPLVDLGYFELAVNVYKTVMQDQIAADLPFLTSYERDGVETAAERAKEAIGAQRYDEAMREPVADEYDALAEWMLRELSRLLTEVDDA